MRVSWQRHACCLPSERTSLTVEAALWQQPVHFSVEVLITPNHRREIRPSKQWRHDPNAERRCASVLAGDVLRGPGWSEQRFGSDRWFPDQLFPSTAVAGRRVGRR